MGDVDAFNEVSVEDSEEPVSPVVSYLLFPIVSVLSSSVEQTLFLVPLA